jgi:predicted metalloenzyme YecM
MRQHTIERFKERFNIDLTDSEYDNLCLICKNDSIGSSIIESPTAYRKIISYKDIYMWVVFTKRRKKVKTVWSVQRKSRSVKRYKVEKTNK